MNKELIKPRRTGKNIEAYLSFFIEGNKGKSIVFTTLKGSFYSPKAFEKALASQRKEIIEKIEKYFKGLVLIPFPQLTLKEIIALIKENE